VKTNLEGVGVNMNKEFVRKMIKAEQLRYEAIKEILPDNIKRKVDKVEKEAFELLKDIALEVIKEKVVDRDSNSEEENKENRKNSKKVNVDFM
jgi:hypothetical protein